MQYENSGPYVGQQNCNTDITQFHYIVYDLYSFDENVPSLRFFSTSQCSFFTRTLFHQRSIVSVVSRPFLLQVIVFAVARVTF